MVEHRRTREPHGTIPDMETLNALTVEARQDDAFKSAFMEIIGTAQRDMQLCEDDDDDAGFGDDDDADGGDEGDDDGEGDDDEDDMVAQSCSANKRVQIARNTKCEMHTTHKSDSLQPCVGITSRTHLRSSRCLYCAIFLIY